MCVEQTTLTAVFKKQTNKKKTHNITEKADLKYKGTFLKEQMLIISICNDARSCSFLMMLHFPFHFIP